MARYLFVACCLLSFSSLGRAELFLSDAYLNARADRFTEVTSIAEPNFEVSYSREAGEIFARLSGDADLRSHNYNEIFYRLDAGFRLEVGEFPVMISDIRMIAGSQVIASNPVFGNRSSTLTFEANGPTLGLSVEDSVTIEGAGIDSVARTYESSGDWILASGQIHFVDLGFSIATDPFDSNAAVTHQYGGVTNFDGYQVVMSVIVLPEPDNLWGVLWGILALVRVRRSIRQASE